MEGGEVIPPLLQFLWFHGPPRRNMLPP
jgi:hypothetical protein